MQCIHDVSRDFGLSGRAGWGAGGFTLGLDHGARRTCFHRATRSAGGWCRGFSPGSLLPSALRGRGALGCPSRSAGGGSACGHLRLLTLPLERVTDLTRQPGDSPAHRCGTPGFISQFSPIGVLMLHDRLGQCVVRTLIGIVEQGSVEVVNRENEIVPIKLLLTIQELLNLPAAIVAFEETRSQNWNQKGHRAQGSMDAGFPILAPVDVVAVLEDKKLFARLELYLKGQSLPKLSDAATLVFVVEMRVAQECRGRVVFGGQALSSPISRPGRAATKPGFTTAAGSHRSGA